MFEPEFAIKPEAKFMEFQELDFHPGVNVTCRMGRKWAEVLDPGDVFRVGCSTREVVKGVAICLGWLIVSSPSDIPENLLYFEHDPKCRDLQGAYDELVRVYGPEVRTSEITVLVFWFYR